MSHSKFKFKNALTLLEREFDPKDTLRWLQAKPAVFFSWGPHDFTVITAEGHSGGRMVEPQKMERGLVFRVQGFKLTGFVLVTLDWSDVYAVHFFDEESNLIESLPGVYVDILVEVIDERVERDEKFYGK